MQYSIFVNNARLDAIESSIGSSPILKVRTGSLPINCAASDTGIVLATINLPINWMEDAINGSKSKSGTWQDITADATGEAAHFRIYASDGITCHLQGTVGLTNADMIVDSIQFNIGQTFTISTFTISAGNN